MKEKGVRRGRAGLVIGRAGQARGWAAIARLIAAVVLIAALLVPPCAEPGPAGTPATVAASAALGQDDGPGTPARPHGILHAGAHCACQLADRLTPPPPIRPGALLALRQAALTAPAYASFEAEPPARPPRA
jgi:hypothetical protein